MSAPSRASRGGSHTATRGSASSAVTRGSRSGHGNNTALRGTFGARGNGRNVTQGGRSKGRGSAIGRGASLNNTYGANGLATSQPLLASSPKPAPTTSSNNYMDQMLEKYNKLKSKREAERAQAIRDGFLADPEKKTTLDKAITPVGTCTEMCPAFERAQRVVQNAVDRTEKTPNESTGRDMPAEDRMVKRFRRSAAGDDEQLPSDIRTPTTLKRTLDYLIDDVIGGDEKYATIHKFVWDRTRSIRNDFSIQQVSKDEDVKVAVDCFERIARFHILSLHHLSNPENLAGGNFDAHQEREQLNNTLLSLMYYYDDHRQRQEFKNEAEFRAYCIILEMQATHPDLEDRMQSWPKELLQHSAVQTAFQLHAAASNTLIDQGPLKPATPFLIAQSNYEGFWKRLKSLQVSYLTACLAESHFGQIRYMALQNIWKSNKTAPPLQQEKNVQWNIDELTKALAFDQYDQTRQFCEAFGLGFKNKAEQDFDYLDFTSYLSEHLAPVSSINRQIFSVDLVEKKRFWRSLGAVIGGVSVKQAIKEGLIDHGDDDEVLDEEIEGDGDDNGLFYPENDRGSQDLSKTSSGFNPAAPTFTPGQKPHGSGQKPEVTSIFSGPSTSTPGGAPSTKTPPFTNPFTKKPEPPKSGSIFGKPPGTTVEEPNDPTGGSFGFNGLGNGWGTAPSEFGKPSVPEKKPYATGSTTIVPNTPPNPSSFSPGSPFRFPTIQPGTEPLHTPFHPLAPSTSQNPPNPPVTSSPLIAEPLQPPPSPRPKPVELPITYPSQPSLFPSASPPFPPSPPMAPAPTAIQNGNQTEGLEKKSFQPSPFPSISTTKPASESSSHPSQITQTSTASVPFPTSSSSVLKSTKSAIPSSFTPAGPPPKKTPGDSKTKNPSPLSRDPIIASPIKKDQQIFTKGERSSITDKAARLLMTEEHGLMQQYVEYKAIKIVEAAFRHFEIERETRLVSEARSYLLARKYGLLWRDIAYKNVLNRRAQHRRSIFSQSNRKEIMKKRRGDEELQAILKAKEEREEIQRAQQRDSLERSLSGSPPAPAIIGPFPSVTSVAGLKRKSLQGDEKSEKGSPNSSHRRINGHKRSRTMGGPSETDLSSHVPTQSSFTPQGLSTSLSGRSILLEYPDSAEIQAAARYRKVDRTNTDYFRLKARGIDPETTIVPHTKSSLERKRRRVDGRETADLASSLSSRWKRASTKIERLNPLLTKAIENHSTSSFILRGNDPAPRSAPDVPQPDQHRSVPSALEDDDDDLLREIREVRNAMSEGAGWFKEQVGKLEEEERRRSSEFESGSSQQASSPPVANASHANGHNFAPSSSLSMTRSEQRLRRTGGWGLATRPVKDYLPGGSRYIPAMSKKSAAAYEASSLPPGSSSQPKPTKKGRGKQKVIDQSYKYESDEDEAGLEILNAPSRTQRQATGHKNPPAQELHEADDELYEEEDNDNTNGYQIHSQHYEQDTSSQTYNTQGQDKGQMYEAEDVANQVQYPDLPTNGFQDEEEILYNDEAEAAGDDEAEEPYPTTVNGQVVSSEDDDEDGGQSVYYEGDEEGYAGEVGDQEDYEGEGGEDEEEDGEEDDEGDEDEGDEDEEHLPPLKGTDLQGREIEFGPLKRRLRSTTPEAPHSTAPGSSRSASQGLGFGGAGASQDDALVLSD